MAVEMYEFLSIGNFLTCIYGKPATGKTNLGISAAAFYSRQGKVAFIDTENTFSPERFKELGGNLSNLIFYKAKSFRDQIIAVRSLLPLSKKLKLIIVDSLTSHYRSLIQDGSNVNASLSKHLSELSDFARNNVPVIITSQVYSTEKGVEMTGSNMLRNWSAAIIRLENEMGRTSFVEKHPTEKNKSIHFEIKKDSICCLDVN